MKSDANNPSIRPRKDRIEEGEEFGELGADLPIVQPIQALHDDATMSPSSLQQYLA